MSTDQTSAAKAWLGAPANISPTEASRLNSTSSEYDLFSQAKRLWLDEKGDDMVEYGLLVVFIALAVASAVGLLTNAIKYAFSAAASPSGASVGK
jgi:Flp pilus assembly pilin Flp